MLFVTSCSSGTCGIQRPTEMIAREGGPEGDKFSGMGYKMPVTEALVLGLIVITPVTYVC